MPEPPGPVRALLAVVVLSTVPVTAQQAPDLLLLAHSPDLPLIEANDNRRPAGALDGGVLVVDLDVVEGDWRVETPDRPGLRVVAVAEAGGPPMIPAPLLRVGEGARVRARVRNRLGAGPVTVFGLHARPSEAVEGFVVEAGETGTVEFEAGAPGTYMYWVREGRQTTWDSVPRFPDRSQAAGAFVVDPAGGSPPDRIMVLSIWGQPVVESGDTTYLEALTINGLSWPYTERFPMSVGDSVRWRVVNASDRNHPMHLHGFFYRVLARGTAVRDSLYAPEDRRLVVTEPMLRKTTMTMEWAPTRPGRWLFHCHLSFHVTPEIRLPGAREMDPRDAHVHMAGLVVGIDVAPGPSDLVRRGPSRAVDLFAGEYGAVPGFRYGFTLDGEAPADSLTEVPGPPLFFHQYEAVDVTVHNRMSVPTGVHWHGLELDAWADGVPGWSASDGRVSPVIDPGQSFTYRLSLMRPGTFIYHSHLDDIHQ
ncbi:MAG: multicopper oxidase domain-containing protein, partial [Longimicrobiales bacterium]|nr:multicopper oxidase domain-containing protein [Longimicrobiales bacterium]